MHCGSQLSPEYQHAAVMASDSSNTREAYKIPAQTPSTMVPYQEFSFVLLSPGREITCAQSITLKTVVRGGASISTILSLSTKKIWRQTVE